MLRDAYENKYDSALLISGDGDFVPAVEYVKLKGKNVENYYFEGRVSLGLLNKCKVGYLIDKKIVNRFFFREEQQTLTIGDTDSAKKLFDTSYKSDADSEGALKI